MYNNSLLYMFIPKPFPNDPTYLPLNVYIQTLGRTQGLIRQMPSITSERERVPAWIGLDDQLWY